MNITARYLLTKDSLTVQRWLDAVLSDHEAVSDEFNWLGLAQSSAQNARGESDRVEALKWAAISLSVYRYLATERGVKGGFNSYELSAMYLRAAMICQFGVVIDHPVLDIQAIITWFRERTSFEREKLVSMTDKWRLLAIEQIRALRQIKNRLSVIELLMDNGYLQDESELQEWVMLKKQLP